MRLPLVIAGLDRQSIFDKRRAFRWMRSSPRMTVISVRRFLVAPGTTSGRRMKMVFGDLGSYLSVSFLMSRHAGKSRAPAECRFIAP
jgi:hypothetical protein